MKRFIIIFILIWTLAEVGSGMRLQKLKQQYGLEYSPISFSFSKDQQIILNEFVEHRHVSLKYDSHLGWDKIELESQLTPKPNSIRVYGNRLSLDINDPICKYLETYSDDINCHDRTVDQYGLGQSLLKFKQDNQNFLDVGVVALLLDSEAINRSLNVFRPFLDPEPAIPLTKPRFILRKSSLALLPNPISSQSALEKMALGPMRLISLFFSGDYFYRYHYIRTWVDLLPSHQLMKVSKLRRMTVNKVPVYVGNKLNAKSEGYSTSLAVLKRFVEEARQLPKQKVIIVFVGEGDKTSANLSKTPLQNTSLAEPLANAGAAIIDATQFKASKTESINALLAKTILERV
ncbi:MAG: hypothetical protein ACI9CF_000406 [Candidatus Omnitrophota bacterium]